MGNITIKEYAAENLADVQRLIAELQDALKKLEPEIIGSGEKVGKLYTAYLLERIDTQRGKIYLAQKGQKIVGLIACYINHDPEDEVEYAYISDIVVDPAERGKGVGTLLMKKADQYVSEHGLEYMRIGALVSNDAAARLYRQCGFQDFLIILQKKLK